jgi:hypothetical protein
MLNRGAVGLRIAATRLLAVIPDRLDRAAFFGLSAAGFFFGIFGLLVNERIAAVIVAFEIIRRGFTTEIAVNALIIDVEFAAGIFRVSVRNVSHKVVLLPSQYAEQYRR